jgi:Ca-activated chloride channel family protein
MPKGELMKNLFYSLPLVSMLLLWSTANLAQAAGTLSVQDPTAQPVRMIDHHVEVVIENGFAKTEVIQEFQNPNPNPTEALYAFPIPTNASLSEMTVTSGETSLQGEVLPKDQAEKVYQEEKKQGNQSGLASKESYQRFEFRVALLEPGKKVTVRFVYYQALKIDSGIGRYVYPLKDGGTDEAAIQFWEQNDVVEGNFSARISVHSVWPIKQMRMPGFDADVQVQQLDKQHWNAELNRKSTELNRDLVFYYRLEDNLPGRVELIPYRRAGQKTGTFMAILTPGIDLKPIQNGADYVFVLDASGSMEAKIHMLTSAVKDGIKRFGSKDRFRLVIFNDSAYELSSGWQTTSASNLKKALDQLDALRSGGSTNIYAGLKLALKDLDDDRATSVILVTDGVTNTGVVDPKAFAALTRKHDIRIFGFLMGNSANWPLMKLIAQESGGFYSIVSTEDDVLGQIMLAKSKIKSEALHDVEIQFKGVQVHDLTDVPQKLYRGQQLVLFGRYDQPGTGELVLKTRMTGKDRSYKSPINLPTEDGLHPELERLWAQQKIAKLEFLRDTGQLDKGETSQGIRDLGVAYQLVTDETSMVVLSDQAFARHQIERRNKKRVNLENQAQNQRRAQPVRSYQADRDQRAFPGQAARPTKGGGALDPVELALLMLALGIILVAAWRSKRKQKGVTETGDS